MEKVYTIIWIDKDGIKHEEYSKIGKALDRYAELANYDDQVLFVEGFIITSSNVV